MCSCLLFLYCIYTTQLMDVLRTTMKNSTGSRRSFSSQLHVEDFCVCFFSAVSYSNDCLVETFGHVIIV
jgi:hypothetical protein